MPIKVTCEKCGGVLHAPDDAGGKKGRCPNCQNILPIPFDAPRAPSAGFGGTAAAPFGSPSSSNNPPPGMAFSSPANPVPPLFPNADAKRPTSLPPPFGMGARNETPGLESSSPALSPPSQHAVGMGSSLTRQSAPFGARPAPSAAMPIAPESTGWRSAAGGFRLMQIAVILFLISIIAPCGVSIYGTNGGRALVEKAGLLKWPNFSLYSEIRLAAFLVPALLGALLLLLGRFKVSSVPSASCARGAGKIAAISTLLGIAGFVLVAVITIVGMKDGFIPELQPKADILTSDVPLTERIHTYFSEALLPSTAVNGQVQRFGLLGLILFGKIAELFFGCTLGRIAAAARNSMAAGRITRCYFYFSGLAVVLLFGALAFDLMSNQTLKDTWNTKWFAMTSGVRTGIVAGSIGVISLLLTIAYLRMLGGVRRVCAELGS